MPKTSDEIIKEIRSLFDQAEGYMKSLEHIDGLYIPTVNQLRYAARHLIDFMTEDNDVEELEKARRHCQRALYDACDAHIQYHINEACMFEEDYKDIEVSDLFPEYRNLVKAKNDAIKFLETGRNQDGRAEMYRQAESFKTNLETITAELPLARDELNRRVAARRKSAIEANIATITGIVGLLIGIIGLASMFF